MILIIAMGRDNLDGLTASAPPVWQSRTTFAGAMPCDRCPADLSHFRARFADGGTIVLLCLDCATAAGLDVYQPAAPIAAAPRRGARCNALVPTDWDSPAHGALEDWQEQGVRHLGHDTEEIAAEIRYGVSW